MDIRKSIVKTGKYITVLFLGIVFLCFARQTAVGVQKGLECIAMILIPSLFPFMALSVLMIRSGFSQVCGKFLSPITKALFGVEGAAAPVIFLMLIGGFPVGAKGIRTLYDNRLITKSEAQHLSVFCISSGPAFMITAVGVRMLNNMQIGVILFISQTLSVIFLGILSRLISVEKKSEGLPEKSDTEPFSESIVHSAYDSATSMLQMGALVILFFAVLEILNSVGASDFLKNIPILPKPIAQNILNICFEVSSACKGLALSGATATALAFAVGWGGLCVHFQVFGILGDLTPSKPLFFLFRFLNAVFSAGITDVLLKLFQPVQSTFSNYTGFAEYTTSTHTFGSIALIFTCVLFVLSFKRKY